MVMVGALAQAQFAETPAPVRDLEWMVGTWEGVFPMSVQGMQLEARTTMVVAKEGPFKRISMTQEIMGMAFRETAFLFFDGKELVMHSFGEMSSRPRIERGTPSKERMVMLSEPWEVSGMGTFVSRTTMERKGDGGIAFKMEIKEGENWTTASSGTFTKKVSG